jgi:hypothetical protein
VINYHYEAQSCGCILRALATVSYITANVHFSVKYYETAYLATFYLPLLINIAYIV